MQGIWLIADSIIAVLALVLGFILHKWISERKIGDASSQAQRLIHEAEREAANRVKTAELEVKEAALKARSTFEDETRPREGKIQQIERRPRRRRGRRARASPLPASGWLRSTRSRPPSRSSICRPTT